MPSVVISGGFGDIRSGDLRFFEEVSKLGDLIVLLWPDNASAHACARSQQH